MPFIAPELIIQAKQMDLLTYLRNYEPYELVRFSGNTYCTRTHDSLKISNGKWIWWSRGIGGRSALDYLIIVGVHFGCCTVCGTGLCEVQRYDRRESNLCVDKVGVFNAEEVGISLHQCVLRTDEAKH